MTLFSHRRRQISYWLTIVLTPLFVVPPPASLLDSRAFGFTCHPYCPPGNMADTPCPDCCPPDDAAGDTGDGGTGESAGARGTGLPGAMMAPGGNPSSDTPQSNYTPQSTPTDASSQGAATGKGALRSMSFPKKSGPRMSGSPGGGTGGGRTVTPRTSGNPVLYHNGSVLEREVDIALPGQSMGWSLVRSYNSALVQYNGTSSVELETPLGHRWLGTAKGPFLSDRGNGTVDLVETASNKRTFVYDNNVYVAPPNYHATLAKESMTDADDLDDDTVLSEVIDKFTLTEHDTGDVFVFLGFDSDVATAYHGRLKERTNRQLIADVQTGHVYSYNAEGYVSKIVPAGEQGVADEYEIDFAYVTSGDNEGRLLTVEVQHDDLPIKRVAYTYMDPSNALHSSDLGSPGDLVQVKTSRRASGDSGSNSLAIVRYTHYRYYKDDGTDAGEEHQLKMVFESDAIQRALDYMPGDPFDSADDLLDIADADLLGDDEEVDEVSLRVFATREFAYYTSNPSVAAIDTAFTAGTATEDLTDYVGSDLDESHPIRGQNDDVVVGLVKSETINGGCGCGGAAGSGTRKDYYYLNVHGFGSDPEEVAIVVVEDTVATDGGDSAQVRRLFGVNKDGIALREATLTNPAGAVSATNVWCQSMLVNADSQVVEVRLPSAHKGVVNSAAKLTEFLDPTTSGDSATVSTSDGVVYYYEYENASGVGNGEYVTGERVSRGRQSNPSNRYYLTATDWTNYGGAAELTNYLPSAEYVFRGKTSTRGDTTGNRVATTFAYTFWDTDEQVTKKITTTLPAIDDDQNGSTAATTTEEHYDRLGQLRWTKDGEGYVNYFSYHPLNGGLAYEAVDVNPGVSIPAGATGNNAKWMSWTDDGSGGGSYSGMPSRGSVPGDALALVTRREFDAQGRMFLTTGPRGDLHYRLYTANQIQNYPYWSTGTNKALLPVQVTLLDDGGTTVAQFGVDPAKSDWDSTPALPKLNSYTPADYVSLTRFAYSKYSGQLAYVDRFYDIDNDSFDTTWILYDALGRAGGVVKKSETGRYEHTVHLYDKFGRVTEVRRGVASAGPASYDDLDDAPLVTPSGFTAATYGYATVQKLEYDDNAVGDGHVTNAKTYYGTGSSHYVESKIKRTYRGHVRGVERTNGGTLVTPHHVGDVDWLGRTSGVAGYSSTVTWTNVLTGDGYTNYLSQSNSGQFNWTKTHYDDLGRVYRVERHPGTSGNRLQANNYYDRRDHLVCAGDKYSAHAESAYDGAGRRYQERIVKNAPATNAYESGAFDFTAPKPVPGMDAQSHATLMTGGNEGMVAMSHMAYNASGNVERSFQFEVNHTETDGLSAGDEDHVRRTIDHWYDSADRLKTTVDYGAGLGQASQTWQYYDFPTRPSSAPTWTDSVVYNGYALLTIYGYDVAGRRDLITSSVKKNSSDTTRILTKSYFDDLGRRKFVVQNWDGSYSPLTSPYSGAAANRTTGWTYNGLGQVVELSAYNSNSTTQTTKYYYKQPYHASLPTHIVYPDSTSTPTSGVDLVTLAYDLDGRRNSLKDQREVVHQYTYTNLRQLEWDKATIPTGSGVYGGSSESDAVQSIKRTYDARGRLVDVYSYAEAGTNPTTVLNRLENYYYDNPTYGDTNGKFWFVNQYHSATGPKSFGTIYDATVDGTAGSSIYNNQLRLSVWGYPKGSYLAFIYGSADSLEDRLGRITSTSFSPSGPNGSTPFDYAQVAWYKYNGVDRLVEADYTEPDVRWQAFEHSTNLQTVSSPNANNYAAWDRFGRTLRKEWHKYVVSPPSATVRDQFDYQYDYAGNRLNRDIPSGLYASNNRDQAFTYDGMLRLATMGEGTLSGSPLGISSPATEENWTLDALGNWETFVQKAAASTTLNQTRSHNTANEILGIAASTGVDWIDPEQDAAGNVNLMPHFQTKNATVTAKYDAWNRLITTTLISSLVQKNEYDGLHRRIVKQADTDANGSLDEVRHYYYNNNWQVIEERKEVSGTEDVDPLNQYIWHPHYIDSLAQRRYDSNVDGTADGVYYYLQDANYNVTAVASGQGGNIGAVVERYAYTAYGEPTVLHGASDGDGAVTEWAVDTGGSDIGNAYLYTGRERDSETGLQNSRYRFYAAHLGRWLQRDPIEYWGGTNLYAYVRGMPTYYVDPWGLVEPHPGIVGGAVSQILGGFPAFGSHFGNLGSHVSNGDLSGAAQAHIAFSMGAVGGSSLFGGNPHIPPGMGQQIGQLGQAIDPESADRGAAAAPLAEAAAAPLGGALNRPKFPCPPNVNLWKAPQRGNPNPADEMINGFDPAKYPGDGPYFGVGDEGHSIAAGFQNSYQNGMQQISMPQSAYDDLLNSGTIKPDPHYPSGSIHVPPSGLPSFNQGIQQGPPNVYIPEAGF